MPRVSSSVVLIGLAALLLAHASTTFASPACSVASGQVLITDGKYKQAIQEFTCVIGSDPTGVEGYRGRIEAELLSGLFSDAVRDYTRVTAFVEPAHPDAQATILAGYAARLAANPNDIVALTGVSFANWWYFAYNAAIHDLNHLLDLQPDNLYGNLFRGSSRVLSGASRAKGVIDFDRAIALAPASGHVRYVVADGYTYGIPDPARAFAEASLALNAGIDTPRIHAILAAAYTAFGNPVAAALEIQAHLNIVTTEIVGTSLLADGGSVPLDLVPGRTFEIPLFVTTGEQVSILTTSPTHTIWDSILLLLAPDGSPVLGSDDFRKYLAGFNWTATGTGTYRLRVTSFEAVSTGLLVVSRN